MHSETTVQYIDEVCNEIRSLLLAKNRKYGDSALNPSRIFSKADAIEQIRVRIDDKLSRIKNVGEASDDEDTLQDLIGYLILLEIAKRKATHDYTSPPVYQTEKSTMIAKEQPDAP